MFRPRIHFFKRLAVLLLKDGVALLGFHGFPLTDLRVHRVIRAAAVHADPADLLVTHPLDEVQRRARMAQHVAALVRSGAVPAVDVVAGVDDEDVAFLDGDALV